MAFNWRCSKKALIVGFFLGTANSEVAARHLGFWLWLLGEVSISLLGMLWEKDTQKLMQLG